MPIADISSCPISFYITKVAGSKPGEEEGKMGHQSRLGFVTCCLLVAGIHGAVFIPILQQEQDINPASGSYKYSYATANGISVVEQGEQRRTPGASDPSLAVEGTYTYLNSADGTLVNVRYFADEGGFRAVPNVRYRPAARAGGVQPQPAAGYQTAEQLRRSLGLL